MKNFKSREHSIYVFITLIVVFLTCCEINTNRNHNGLSDYSINIQSLEPKYYPENLVKSVRYLKLETNHKNLIKGIDKIRFVDENIFILDRKTNSVHVFDTNGRYKKKFFHYGSGPGEYINLTDFDVTRDNKYIFMLDMNQGKLVIYNMNDSLIKEIKLEFKTHSFSYVQDNVLVFYQMNRQNDLKKYQNNLVLWDFEKEEFIKGFLPITNPNFLFGSWESLYVSEHDVYFCPNLTNL